MADPRFYDNRGPFTLADICGRAHVSLVGEGADEIADLATVVGAGPAHLTFFTGTPAAEALRSSQAGYCFVAETEAAGANSRTRLISCASVQHAFAAAAQLFYPEHGSETWEQDGAIHPSARLEPGVRLAPGVVVGPTAEIGARTRIGPNSVIGRGVSIGRDCAIGSQVGIGFACVGDRVHVLAGAQIGQSGFGFASSSRGHTKIPQLGRVIVQDDVEIGACTTIDRGALGDTVIGEGTKIDNLVQIGHNNRIGRHCIIVAQAGISGSCNLGQFVVLGGQTGLADHVSLGDGARLAARAGATRGEYPGGEDYGGAPLRPVKIWRREVAALALLARRRKRDRDG
jgi:UDP-3-O-[3-hydroxymyristoyl] glucosamine N-acyltransferase